MADYSWDMSLKIGIVGLPNVGKSTLFNALTKQAAKAQNVPFTTITPNVGVVAVPDDRLTKLTALSKSVKTTPTTIEFVDIAGLVKNAHQGEGLGNQFLANIRAVNAIAHVVRFFDNSAIIHVEQTVDPKRDVEIINTELILADLAVVDKMRSNLDKKIRGNDKAAQALDVLLAKMSEHLNSNQPARTLSLTPEEVELSTTIPLLTGKPVLYIANVGDQQTSLSPDQLTAVFSPSDHVLPISVKIEQELVQLPDEERLIFLHEYGLEQTGLDRLIQASYSLLNLITFFTSGPTESRAWTVPRGAFAPQAAGQIHSDMERGFIRAETVVYDDLISAGSHAAARSAGHVRDEGKTYLVQDGDVMFFKFSA